MTNLKKRLDDLEITQDRQQSDELVFIYTYPDGSHTRGDDTPLMPDEFETIMLSDAQIIEIVYCESDEPGEL